MDADTALLSVKNVMLTSDNGATKLLSLKRSLAGQSEMYNGEAKYLYRNRSDFIKILNDLRNGKKW